jgi:aspartyl protease family protein
MPGNGYSYAAAALAGIVLLAPSLKREQAGAEPAETQIVETSLERRAGNGVGTVELDRSPDRHFYAEGQVNGARIRFLVDTGASKVVLSHGDAQRAGIATGNYSAVGRGAGGQVRLLPVTIARLGLGPVSAEQVPAMVAEEGALTVSLLGQSYLSRLESVTIEGDRMILR